MKTLLLARHAKSDWNQPGYSDFDRPLNPRGEMDAPVIASRLQKNYTVEQIISSDAARALATATHYKNVLTADVNILQEHLLYNADRSDIAEVISSVSNSLSTVMIVGHNPGMTDMVNYLVGNSITNMSTCSVAVITFLVNDWCEIKSSSGDLIAFEYPKK